MARSQLIKSVLTTGSATVVRHVHSDDRTRRELVTLQFHVSPVPQRRTYDRRVCSGTAALLLGPNADAVVTFIRRVRRKASSQRHHMFRVDIVF